MSDNLLDRDAPLSIKKDSQINVVVNRNEGDDGTIDLMRVFHNMKLKRRVYAWVLVLCVIIGVCAPLLLYQYRSVMLRVSSVVTLNYTMLEDGTPVQRLVAPDGEDLDLTQLTSAYVLQGALERTSLTDKISIGALRDSIQIDRILTEDSRRQQEVASKMLQDKNSAAYTQLQSVKLTYINQFIVSMDNRFNLTDEELRNLLNQVLQSYNDYLAKTYADMYLPADEVSIIDINSLDIMESLDLLQGAMNSLYDYCDSKPDEIKAYRSWRDGRSLEDLETYISTIQSVSIDYLYSYVYANSLALDREAMLSKYQYQLRSEKQDLSEINGNITTMKSIIDSYKPDVISVDNQTSDSSKSTKVTTDFYNELVLSLAEEYEKAAQKEIKIADLEDKMSALEAQAIQGDAQEVKEELQKAVDVCAGAYKQVYEHMQEVVERPFYTAYTDFTSAQGSSVGFLGSNLKNMVLGCAVGAILACGLWFVSAFTAELKRGSRKEDGKEEA
ncbi:MAG: hypothetical protein J5649_00200 [Lachnospiraceae bacterium]|nr:hypothetical protein [Lachnospiraceae bacterium]